MRYEDRACVVFVANVEPTSDAVLAAVARFLASTTTVFSGWLSTCPALFEPSLVLGVMSGPTRRSRGLKSATCR
jgi:hypothetical protein